MTTDDDRGRDLVMRALSEGPFPAPPTAWIRRAPPGHPWAEAASRQVVFARDVLLRAACETRGEALAWRPVDPDEWGCCMVNGTHTSKSNVLPVFGILPLGQPWGGILRGNFHDWKLTVQTDSADLKVDIDHGTLFDPHAAHDPTTCEGLGCFVRGPYAADRGSFTVSVRGEHELFAVVHKISRWARAQRR